MSLPRFSVVIVAYGARAATARCLDSIERSLGESLGDQVELVLVDNASPDDTLALFAAWRDRATVVALDRNRNFAGGCNAGAAAATADVVVFLNNDTIVEPGALEALADEAARPDVGAAGLRLLYLDGTLQHAGVAMIREPSGHVVPNHLFHHQDGQLPAARVTYDLDAVTAACLAMRRELFLELGGYDEGYVNGWEDVDLCLRTRMAGKRVVYRGDLWLWHDEGQSRGEVRGVDANVHHFYSRWGALLDSDEELVARVFGGRFPSLRVAQPLQPASVVVTGMLTGASAGAAEARGILTACSAAGLAPAARELVPEMVEADLVENEEQELSLAIARPALQPSLELYVSPKLPAPSRGILRIADVPEEPVEHALAIWAASPLLRDQLIATGLDPGRVAWLPPCVPTGPPGPGGDGLLTVLPGHDLLAAEVALDALEPFAGERMRIVPTVASSNLLSLVADRLPAAELVQPCTSDARFRELVATADVVLCADPDDAFERRSLIAAGAGAATVSRLDGPAHAVLGERAVPVARFTPGHVRAALERAVTFAEARTPRALAVRSHCAADRCGTEIATLLRALSTSGGQSCSRHP